MDWSERIGRRIKLRDLHIMLAVVQCGSMTKAAQQLAVSKPVVSKVIADLEHVLGVRLIDRDRHGVEPTIYGAALLKRGTVAFDELRQGVKDIEFLSDPSAGELRVGSADVLLAAFLPAIITRLHRRHPRINFEVKQSTTVAALYHELRQRNVDLVLARILLPIAEQDLSTEILFDEPLVVVAGRRNRWRGRRNIELADLIHEPWVLPPEGSGVATFIRDTFRACGLEFPRANIICDSPQMYAALLEDGPYLSMRPVTMIRFGVKHPAVKVLPIKLPALPRPVGIITLRRRTVSPVMQLFIDNARLLAKLMTKRA
jgi:DNA-binding transcriptional LysR family regulator